MKNLALPVFGAVLFLSAAAAPASVLFDAGDANPVNGVVVSGTIAVADDFNVSSNSTLTSVAFSTLEGTGATWNSTISYQIWNSAGDRPGTGSALASGLGQGIVKTPLNTGISIAGDSRNPFTEYRYEFNLDNAVDLIADTPYWLELFLGEATSGVLWTRSAGGFGETAWLRLANEPVAWVQDTNRQLAFQLLGDVLLPPAGGQVPAPAPLLLLGAGFLGVIAVRRRLGAANGCLRRFPSIR